MPDDQLVWVLDVVPRPDPDTTVTLGQRYPDEPIPTVAAGNLTAICGACRNVLLRSIALGQFQGGFVHCARCGAYLRLTQS